jgi:hypothetical protein
MQKNVAEIRLKLNLRADIKSVKKLSRKIVILLSLADLDHYVGFANIRITNTC